MTDPVALLLEKVLKLASGFFVVLANRDAAVLAFGLKGEAVFGKTILGSKAALAVAVFTCGFRGEWCG